MYTYIGLGLMSVFALMITPGNYDPVNNGLVFYGFGTITQYDKDGNEVLSQTVHNRLVNQGEEFLEFLNHIPYIQSGFFSHQFITRND